MDGLWKTNWPWTREHFCDWWQHRGLVLGAWGTGLPTAHPHAIIEPPFPPDTVAAQHTTAEFIAHNIRYKMANRIWPADILPAAWPHIGTLPLAAYLGAKQTYTQHQVWYQSCMSSLTDHPPLRLDASHPEVRQLEQILRRSVEVASGNYFIGMPALLGGVDVLAELRGTAELLMDMIDDPAAVHRRLEQIQIAYEQSFDRMYELLKLPDESMCFGYFMLWGEGATGLCQCDTAGMLSPAMFREFVVPYLKQQCEFLANSMFHIDGAQALIHLPALLELSDLDAIEFTPDPKSPGGGDKHWYELYRGILDAGKSLWVANLTKDQVIPLLDAIGGSGVYVSVNGLSEADGEDLAQQVDQFRVCHATH